MDVNPITPGHLLVVANDHFVGLADTPPAVMTAIVELGQRCAAALRAGNFRADGINLILADGKAAMQEVDHVHLHVLPRYAGDSFRMRADREFNANRSELESAAATLGRALPAATAD
jgi:diadenosine tetraphosphate (Ap4A) HIT family hydrolase